MKSPSLLKLLLFSIVLFSCISGIYAKPQTDTLIRGTRSHTWLLHN